VRPFRATARSSYAVHAVSRANLRGDPEPHTEPSLRERLRRPWTPPAPRPSQPLPRKGPSWSVSEQIRSAPASSGCHTPTRTSTNVQVTQHGTAPAVSRRQPASAFGTKRSQVQILSPRPNLNGLVSGSALASRPDRSSLMSTATTTCTRPRRRPPPGRRPAALNGRAREDADHQPQVPARPGPARPQRTAAPHRPVPPAAVPSGWSSRPP